MLQSKQLGGGLVLNEKYLRDFGCEGEYWNENKDDSREVETMAFLVADTDSYLNGFRCNVECLVIY